MRDAILAAVVCGGVVATGTYLCRVLRRRVGGRSVIPGLDDDLARVLVAAPGCWLLVSLAFWWLRLGGPLPWLVPLLAGATLAVLAVGAGRLLVLAAMSFGVQLSPAAAVLVSVAAGWWAWVLGPGHPWQARAAGVAVLGAVLLVERVWAAALDVAVKRREIISTGLRPLVVDDPAWELEYVYVSPDRRSISVGYENPRADNSLSIDLLQPEHHALVPVQTGGPPFRRLGRSSLRFLARVHDQVVRLEFDHGDGQEVEAARLARRLRPVDAGELAQRDAGLAART